MPSVSVIIPAYNPGSYLTAAVQSVIAQSYNDWEIIVVDDGSPEDVSFVKELHPFINVVRQKNQGQSIARNVGISHASGEFVAFLDQDDLWRPTKLQRQIALMSADAGVALCHTQFEIIDADGCVMTQGFGRQQTYEQMLTGGGICGATTVMVRRDCLAADAFNTRHEPAEDYDLWLRLTRSHRTAFIPTVEAQYRQHGTNQTRRYRDTYYAILRILQEHKVEAQIAGRAAAASAARTGMRRIRPTYGAQAFDQARQSLRQRRWRHSLSHMTFALSYAPRYVFQSLVSRGRGQTG